MLKEKCLLKPNSTVKYLEGCQYGTDTEELIGILRVFQMASLESVDFFIAIHLNATKGHLHVHFFMTFPDKGAKVSRVFRILHRSTCGHRSTDISDLLPYLLCPHDIDCSCGLEKCHACKTPACFKCGERLRLCQRIEETHGSMEAYL